jgi:hypothetical protein
MAARTVAGSRPAQPFQRRGTNNLTVRAHLSVAIALIGTVFLAAGAWAHQPGLVLTSMGSIVGALLYLTHGRVRQWKPAPQQPPARRGRRMP